MESAVEGEAGSGLAAEFRHYPGPWRERLA
jgi:hypothetical protein